MRIGDYVVVQGIESAPGKRRVPKRAGATFGIRITFSSIDLVISRSRFEKGLGEEWALRVAVTREVGKCVRLDSRRPKAHGENSSRQLRERLQWRKTVLAPNADAVVDPSADGIAEGEALGDQPSVMNEHARSLGAHQDVAKGVTGAKQIRGRRWVRNRGFSCASDDCKVREREWDHRRYSAGRVLRRGSRPTQTRGF